MAETITETIRLLVVSRESDLPRLLYSVAESNLWQVESAMSAWDVMERMQSGVVPHLLLLDLPRSDGDGMHILRWLRRLRPDLPVIVSCFPEDAGRQREATRLGAQEVLIRPFDEARLESVIRRHLASPGTAQGQIDSEDTEQLGPDSFFVSASPITHKLRAQAELLAEADVPVLILGEAGSGKDTIARLIHKLSVRSGFKFLKVSCAGMPGELLEAELFGSERTFPPGTTRMSPGKFERADKGTIFLDEITEMPLGVQDRLMHVLHDRMLPRKSNASPVPVDVRILAASSANIERALAERRLREDLYYRLSTFTVQVPPLRQRRAEIAVFLRYVMHRLARHYGLPPREFPPIVLDACQQYSWPGNLKELEAFVKRYLVAGDKELTFGFGEASVERVSVTRHPVISLVGTSQSDEEQSGPPSLKSLIHGVKCEAEKNAIGTALRKTSWNRKAAARLLQVSYRTLLYKIDQYHMNSPESFLDPLPETQLPLAGAEIKGKAGRAASVETLARSAKEQL